MNIKDISQKNEIIEKEKESSSDDQLDSSSTKYYVEKLSKIILEREESPDIVIEKILINIFNKYITPGKEDKETSDIQTHQNKIKLLCLQLENSKIIYILLSKIRSLIKKYREKLFELPNVIELREKIFQKYYKRSHSYNKLISDNYINFCRDKQNLNNSYCKIKKKFNYFLTIKNLFCELQNIKNCLRRTAPIIEKIFEVPLSKYQKFSIWECEKEDYLKILIHDDFIWNQICKSRNSYLNDIISEIIEDNNMNLTEMTERIDYFKLIEDYKKINIDDMLRIPEFGSSLETRFPEEAKPIISLREDLYKKIITEDKDLRNSNEDADIEDYTNSEEHNNDNMPNINQMAIIKTERRINIKTKSNDITKGILERPSLRKINISKDNKYIDIPNLLKNNDLSSKENFEKIISLNKNAEIKKIYEKNINSGQKQRKKVGKNKNIKKENNDIKKSNKKIDKNEIPSDIDDLVKYIVNDDKTEGPGKKKKKNKKKKKKNKNEIKEEKKEEKKEDLKEKDNMDEIDEIKDDLIKNSVNRYKIHKIKFIYRPKWLEKITKKNT